MKKLLDYFVNNSVLVNIITVLILFMGIFSIFSLNKETFPNVDFNFIIIRTTFSGTAAEDVEKLLTIDIERELKQVDGIEELNSMSAEGGSIVSIKVDPDFDTDEVLIDVKDAMDRLTDLPEDVERPIVTKITNKDRGIMNVAIFGKDEESLRKAAKRIQDKLEIDSRISKATLMGYRDEVFDVQVRPDQLQRYDVTLSEIVQAIKDRQVNISAGNIKNKDKEVLVRILKENETVEAVENIVVRSNDLGNVVRVKDLATVKYTLKDKTREDRANGELAIFLDIVSKSSADVLDTAEFIKETFDIQSKELGVNFKVFTDMSFYVKRRLGVLSQNGFQGIILVVVCLLLFMNFRVSLITALGAPFSFFVTFIIMDAMGMTINLISMFGLIMVLGMLVDDAIIVSEQFFQKMEHGMNPREAAKAAAIETIAPVTATILTTMVAFGSLLFMEGIMGKFLWSVPLVIIIALSASLFESYIILPAHLADWAGKIKNVEKDKWYKPLLNFYEKILRLALTYAKSTIILFIFAFLASAFLITQMRFELFPADDVTFTTIYIKGPVGTPFDVTNAKLTEIEKVIQSRLKKDELVGFRTMTGFQSFNGGRSKTGPHYGSILIELTMQDDRDRSTDAILNDLNDGIKPLLENYEYNIERMRGGPPTGKPVNVEFYGEDLNELLTVSTKLKSKLLENQGILSAELDYEIGKKQLIVDIDEKEARRLGVSNIQVAMELRRAFEGVAATTIKKSEDDIDIWIRLDEESRSRENILKELKIANNQGLRIPLSRIAKFKSESGAYMIRRFNRKRAFSVSGEVDLKRTTSKEINAKLPPIVDDILKDHPNITYALTGENKDTNDSLQSFAKAFIVSIFIIFIMLLIQFNSLAQPLLVMSAIPFALIGVVISFAMLKLPIGFMALMGMLGLVGVVINDSIILVTFINRTLETSGMHLEALIKATLTRFRPVLLTTITTVAGLLPVAHAPGGDPFLKPMATSFAYGLLFSSSLTLIFIPCSYLIYINIRGKFNKGLELE